MQNVRGVSRKPFPRQSASNPNSTGIKATVRRSVPPLPYEQLVRIVLGPRYELSLVLCGDALARKLNKQHRHKTYAANVLSFPLSATEGEIFLNVVAAAREARRFETTSRKRLALLFVHGLLHLKGLRHGRTMDTRERKILRAFGLA